MSQEGDRLAEIITLRLQALMLRHELWYGEGAAHTRCMLAVGASKGKQLYSTIEVNKEETGLEYRTYCFTLRELVPGTVTPPLPRPGNSE